MNIVAMAKAAGIHLAISESLTGGLVCSALIENAGASEVVLGGVVAYQDELKSQLLGVDAQLIRSQSAVDPEVAAQMAVGVRSKLATKCGVDEDSVIGVSTTGVAGPDPVGTKPVGLCYLGISSRNGIKVISHEFSGDRQAIRAAAVAAAMRVIEEEISSLVG